MILMAKKMFIHCDGQAQALDVFLFMYQQQHSPLLR
jgi:hypothetical protein